MRKYTMALCEGRHSIPAAVDGSVFPNTVDPTDLDSLKKTCHERLKDCSELSLYVTGLTVALTTVISYCVKNAIPLTLYHFDRESGEYYAQPLLAMDPIANYDYGYSCVTGV
jgi:hypothetical protein